MSTKQKKNDENSCKITIEELKTFEGFENISDEEAIQIIDCLHTVSLIAYSIFTNVKK